MLTATPVPAAHVYTVAAGDTLSGIAARSCGDAQAWPGIWHANQAEVPNPDVIYPGQALTFTCAELAAAQPAAQSAVPPPSASSATVTGAHGIYSCAALESLWEQAGGPAGEAEMAASVAMAESGGNPDAVSPTADYGLWQINEPAHPGQATLDPAGNARAAVAISSGGTNWEPWVTYQTGAYRGKC
jgi:Lysozyme like domain/LysM domain